MEELIDKIREHCVITADGGPWVMFDLNSTEAEALLNNYVSEKVKEAYLEGWMQNALKPSNSWAFLDSDSSQDWEASDAKANLKGGSCRDCGEHSELPNGFACQKCIEKQRAWRDQASSPTQGEKQ